jgi:hypothetical protein
VLQSSTSATGLVVTKDQWLRWQKLAALPGHSTLHGQRIYIPKASIPKAKAVP